MVARKVGLARDLSHEPRSRSNLPGCSYVLDVPSASISAPEGPITQAEELFRLMSAAQAQVVTLQGDGKLRVESPQGSGTVSAWLAVSRPGLLRVEMFDFFNRPIAVLVTDGQRFGLFQAQENKFYQGPATPRTSRASYPWPCRARSWSP